MWPDRVSSPGPLALESDTLPTVLRGPAGRRETTVKRFHDQFPGKVVVGLGIGSSINDSSDRCATDCSTRSSWPENSYVWYRPRRYYN